MRFLRPKRVLAILALLYFWLDREVCMAALVLPVGPEEWQGDFVLGFLGVLYVLCKCKVAPAALEGC